MTGKTTPLPSPSAGGRSLHSGPWREGHRALPRSGPINRSVRPSTPGGQVAGPVIHDPPPTLEQVRAPVGCLDLAADLVRQGSLHHLARMIGLFGAQSRKLDRKPCGTAAAFNSRSSSDSAVFAIGFPPTPENTKGAAGVMEGPGERSPRSGVRRGRSPSPAPMYYIG